MSTKLYVDNLAAATSRDDLAALFSAYGNVLDVDVAVDHASRNPRGFGFVTMLTPAGAQAAIQALHGKAFGTCALTVSDAYPPERHANSPKGRRPARRSISQLY